MRTIEIGQYRVRPAAHQDDVTAAQQMRHVAFRGGVAGVDTDTHDDHCLHVLIEHRGNGHLAGCFRLLELSSGSDILTSYSAQWYDLGALSHYPGPITEMGRLCTAERRPDPEILRSAWAALAAYVDDRNLAMLFGCASFHGRDPKPLTNSFAYLHQKHAAPRQWAPGIKAANVFRFDQLLGQPFDAKAGQQALPALLRSYLALGGWVSDHAVIDEDLGTTHVFTGLEIAAIPEPRKRLLRASAAQGLGSARAQSDRPA